MSDFRDSDTNNNKHKHKQNINININQHIYIYIYKPMTTLKFQLLANLSLIVE